MPQLINWELIRQPINWVIVALMLMIATFALHLIMGDHGTNATDIGSTM